MSIQIKRGMKKDLPQLKDGELAFCKDTKELYVGSNGNENVNVSDRSSEIINGFDNKIKEIESTLSSNIEQTKTNKEYIESKKSVIQRAIDFVDAFKCDFLLENNGYIKLPTVLGGLILQWGSHYRQPDHIPGWHDQLIYFPKEFNEIFTVNLSHQLEYDAKHKVSRCSIRDITNTMFNLDYYREEGYHGIQFKWFAIGR